MKKILLTLFFLAAIFHPSAFAQDNTVLPMPTDALSPSPAPTPVNYELPYPGILPGSPLYTVKVFRDKVNEFFMKSPSKKSNFYLLQADKRLAASLELFKKEDPKLGEETLAKSLIYLDKSVDKMGEAKKSGENISDILGKIKTSTEKQIEEIGKLKESAKGKEAEKLMIDYQRAQEIQNRVDSFRP
jgi:hypothetical protein